MTHSDINKPYWIAKFKNDNIVHYGKIKKGNEVTSARLITTYANKQDWLDILVELNIDITDL